MFVLSFFRLNLLLFSLMVFPAAAAIGISRVIVPSRVLPPRCHSFILSMAFLIILPMPIRESLIFPSATLIPRVAAFLKLDVAATADARNCW